MSLILYINGQQLDHQSGQVIAQTKQVNDINSIENRQAGYTNKFKVPKTARNVRIINFLTITGNTSRLPYQKNECSLYNDAGDCFVYKGRAVVTDGGDSYEVVIYDGIIELFKEIENTPLSVLGLDGLNHDKNVAAVIASWAESKPYCYILADYNGSTGDVNNNEVNIDYLVPSVNVAWLWEKIFDTYGFGWEGSVFQTENFKNLWMTYPKGLSTSDSDLEIMSATDYIFNNNSDNIFGVWDAYIPGTLDIMDTDFTHITLTGLPFKHIKVKESGTYRLEIEGTIHANRNFQMLVGQNMMGTSNDGAYNATYIPHAFTYNQQEGETFAYSGIINMNANDSICLILKRRVNQFRFKTDEESTLTMRLVKVTPNEINFSNAFADFSITDFLKEVVHRFGLTMYKDKYSSNYRFLTLREQLQTSEITDWSGKFVKKISENYIHGSYAQKNWLRYAYNDKESSHSDGEISIDNSNLPDTKDIIKSKIYSPESAKSLFLGSYRNVYKLWDKEIVEDPEEGEEPVTYKSLDKRFYFLRAAPLNRNLTAVSNALGTSAAVSNSFAESFYNLGFPDIIQDYYGPLQQILNDALLVNAELFLTDTDIANFDFKKLYYIEQLSSHFIVNKINNYVPGKPVKCELVKVRYAPPLPPPPAIKIYKVIISNHDVAIYYQLNINVQSVKLQVYGYSGAVWMDYSTLGYNPFPFNSTPSGDMKIRLTAAGEFSNEVAITVPANPPVTILIP